MGYFSFLLIFFITILIHESGHLFACKIYKVPVNEFVIGLGFTLFSFTYKETIFSIKLLPICGYISNGNKNENAKYLKDGLKKLGFDTGNSQTPIIPLMLGDEHLAQDFSKKLLENGLFAKAIVYPTVAKGKARVRIMNSAVHSKENLDNAISIFREVGKNLKVI